ncbi:nucleotidyltransferase family protein [Paenibacillus radicis (ex Xue et al. 2023)]|uniref:Nucleotidyltransferase family protein n=1 Tax=Paenibacillus radicis (ex Xue et al. 2023) TaxID=2972489 RepID=A0ABT1YGB3_9BACL|nr:nucleotidyltransferase family protein [Paenibacillus radicis (ex Xue et al. 2023)]MCR8631992.1 nucleotidyltransferase family protein [Paenibacillus radicis (ex Xue et al. 2023)]
MRWNNIVGIYLAAGQSTRMGSDKLRLPVGPMNLGNYALAAALSSSLDYVLVVSKDAETDWMDNRFYRDPIKRKWSVIYCSEAHLGQAHSLRCGVRAAQVMEAAAVMIILADQPFITKEMMNELLNRFETNSSIGFVASSYDGLARPPVIFAQRMFPELLRLQNDQGARHLIRKETSGICIDFANPDLFMDVDTAEDYRILLEKSAFWKS